MVHGVDPPEKVGTAVAQLLMKPDPDEDCYVVYSTIVDGFTDYGTRADMLALAGTHGHPSSVSEQETRLDHCDLHGTSALPGAYGERALSWDEDPVLIRDGAAELRCLPRAHIRAYVHLPPAEARVAFAALPLAIDDDDVEPVRSHTLESFAEYRQRQHAETQE